MNKKAIFSSLFLLFFLFCYSKTSFGEVIVLKSGEKIEGTVIKKSDKYITLDYKGSVIAYHPFEVQSIDGKDVGASASVAAASADSKNLSQEVVQLDVVTAEECLKRGAVYSDRGNFDQAISELNHALKIKPAYPEAYLVRGFVYVKEGKIEQAMADYNKAIEMNPKYEEAYYVRGLAYAGENKPDLALADYNKALEINPLYIQAYLNRASINAAKGKVEAVVADIAKVIKINPSIPAAYFIRGLGYASANNIEQAISDYGEAIRVNPDYTEAYLNRALAYAFKDKIEQQKGDLNSPKAYVDIGLNYTNPENFKRALADCNKVIEAHPDDWNAYMVRARIYLLANDYDKVWADVHKSESLGHKTDPDFLASLKKDSGREK